MFFFQFISAGMNSQKISLFPNQIYGLSNQLIKIVRDNCKKNEKLMNGCLIFVLMSNHLQVEVI
ncbi:hypothetical protein pb186bvf_019753 [Paramecium bursaria]